MSSSGAGTLLSLPGYEIASEFRRTGRYRFHSGRRSIDGLPVIIKYPATVNSLTRHCLRREFDLIHGMRAPGIIRALDWIDTSGGSALILEDFGGRSIRNLLRWNKLKLSTPNLAEFFSIALRMTEALDFLHEQDIIHRDVSPEIILLNRRTGELKIMDFSAMSLLSQESELPLHPTGRAPAYISPELTGRMNRLVDYRSDYYSLGVILYELLTGRLPFEAGDPWEFIYQHMASAPEPPDHIEPEIPAAVSRIVMKLLAREAENRYRGAFGLRRDLLRCRDEFARGSKPDFQPGAFDGSARFRVADKLYGRESEVKRLLESFSEARAGAVRLVLLRGYAGTGKSALLQELRKYILAERGLFACGKFNQHTRDFSDGALVQAARELVRSVPPEQMLRGRKTLIRSLGGNGGLLTDAIPELEGIIGAQPPAGADTAMRDPASMNNALRLLFRSFAQPEHPLVLCLDDLHRADRAALTAIRRILRDPLAGHILIIGAYRDSRAADLNFQEDSPAQLRSANHMVRSMALRPLSMAHVRELIMDTLLCNEQRAVPLGRLVMARTGGNPFFVNEFMRTLHRRGLLTYDEESRTWVWDTEEIRDRSFTNTVVELLASNIRALSPRAGRVLQLAACLGGTFKLNILAIACEMDHDVCMAQLWEAVQCGIILPLDETRPTLRAYLPGGTTAFHRNIPPTFRFPHEGVQQAAYSLIREDEKSHLHLEIARRLMSSKHGMDLFNDVVNHLNLGGRSITNPAELLQAARMNLTVAEKARERNAFHQAGEHLAFALEFLERGSSHPWQEHYDFTVKLHLRRAECFYLARDPARSEETYKLLTRRVRDRPRKAKVLATLSLLQFGANQYMRAIDTARKGLRLFKIRLPRFPGSWSIALAAFAVRRLWAGLDPTSLLHAPEMKDPDRRGALTLMASLGPSACVAAPALLDLIALKMTYLTMRHGRGPESAYAYAAYGLLLAGRFKRYQEAHEFGNLAVRLVEKFQLTEMKCSVRMLQAIFINHWVVPLRTNIPFHRVSYEAGVQTGDFPHASYVLYYGLWQRIMAGENLFALEIEYKAYAEFIRRTRDQNLIPTLSMMMAMIHRLRDSWGDAGKGAWFHETTTPTPTSYPIGEHFRDIACMLTTFFEGRYADTLLFAQRAEATRVAARGQITEVALCFYRGLAAARLFRHEAGMREKSRLRRLTRKAAIAMETWARLCPENFAGKYFLLQGELAVMSGSKLQARKLMLRAMRASRASGFPHEIALACESAAALHAQLGRRTRAWACAREACKYYEAWDANLPLFRLRRLYPEAAIET